MSQRSFINHHWDEYKRLKKWLESKPVVIAAYWGRAKGANVRSMLRIWRSCQEDGFTQFEDLYPNLADDFEVLVIEDGRTIADIASRFKDCPHVKVWIGGEVFELSEVAA